MRNLWRKDATFIFSSFLFVAFVSVLAEWSLFRPQLTAKEKVSAERSPASVIPGEHAVDSDASASKNFETLIEDPS